MVLTWDQQFRSGDLLVVGDSYIETRATLGGDMATKEDSTTTNNNLQETNVKVKLLIEQMVSMSQSINLLQKLDQTSEISVSSRRKQSKSDSKEEDTSTSEEEKEE